MSLLILVALLFLLDPVGNERHKQVVFKVVFSFSLSSLFLLWYGSFCWCFAVGRVWGVFDTELVSLYNYTWLFYNSTRAWAQLQGRGICVKASVPTHQQSPKGTITDNYPYLRYFQVCYTCWLVCSKNPLHSIFLILSCVVTCLLICCTAMYDLRRRVFRIIYHD